jgi:hypothetical protein
VSIVFPEEVIAARFRDFFVIANDFCSTYNNAFPEMVPAEVDRANLFMTVVATYDDIARYKSYHLSDPSAQRANAIKRSAFASKWIMRFSPIIHPKISHLTGTSKNTHDSLSNAMFAIHLSLVNIINMTNVKFDLSDLVYYDLLYDLMFRNMDSDALMFIYDRFSDLAKGTDIVIIRTS